MAYFVTLLGRDLGKACFDAICGERIQLGKECFDATWDVFKYFSEDKAREENLGRLVEVTN